MARFPHWRERPYNDVLRGFLHEMDDEGNLKNVARKTELALDHVRYPGDTFYVGPDGSPMWRPLADILADAPISNDRFGYGAFDTGPMPE